MRDIRFISCESRDYPEKFKNLPDYPYGIYVKGNLPREDCISVGMIGARICSDYGRAMTKKFAEALSRNNIQIISGMAAGIDAESSLGAINAGGRTYVVLGCGVDVIYPTENVDLYDAILLFLHPCFPASGQDFSLQIFPAPEISFLPYP